MNVQHVMHWRQNISRAERIMIDIGRVSPYVYRVRDGRCASLSPRHAISNQVTMH